MSGIFDFVYRNSPTLAQEMMLNAYAVRIQFERFGRGFREKLKELELTQWYSMSELEEYQNQRLRRLISHAYNTVPYYRRVMKERKLFPDDIKVKEDLHKMPILKREDIRQNCKDLISTTFNRFALVKGHTSGTTGSPLDIYWDINMCEFHNAADWRQKHWAGFDLGGRYAVLQGRTIVPIGQKRPPFWRLNRLHNQLFLSAFHLKMENLGAYVNKLESFRPQVIEGYPSALFILAKYLRRINKTLPVKAVLTSSETLFASQRDAIEESFACKVFDFYGMAERTIFATECNRHEGHHLNMEYGITEFLNEENEPAERGRLGRIVTTGLHNFAMPLLRYETSDVSLVQARQCSCGRLLPLMDDITTKAEDIVVTKDGRYVSPSVLTHPFKPMHNIEASQIIQENVENIVVRIVRRAEYTERDTEMLLMSLRQRIGNDMNVRIDFVDSLEREASGKFRWVISKVPLDL